MHQGHKHKQYVYFIFVDFIFVDFISVDFIVVEFIFVGYMYIISADPAVRLCAPPQPLQVSVQFTVLATLAPIFRCPLQHFKLYIAMCCVCLCC